MNTITSMCTAVQNRVEEVHQAVGKCLDKNPTVYKVVLVVCHLFRMIAMFGIMMRFPAPTPVTAAIMVGGTLLYRTAVERFCCFRFAIPSLVGAGAAQLAYPALVNLASGTALASFGTTFANALRLFPLSSYLIGIIKISHDDIEERLSDQKACPRNSQRD